MAVLVGGIWAAFAVELGDKTFAEHIDTIGATPEAKQLVDDTRATINPALADVRDRVLGEYVEAPTWIPDAEAPAARERPAVHASGRGVEPALPGRRRPAKPAPPVDPGEDSGEDLGPPLPGRRR